jgi:hypothetical protein
MKRAQLVIFHPYKTPLRTDRKTATYPTAMRVCTFVRIEMGGKRRRVILTTKTRSVTALIIPLCAPTVARRNRPQT